MAEVAPKTLALVLALALALNAAGHHSTTNGVMFYGALCYSSNRQPQQGSTSISRDID